MPKLKGKLTSEVRRMMLADMRRAHELVNERDYSEAKKVVEKVAAGLAWANARSAHVIWALAVVNDYLGDLGEALKHIMEAIRMDPLEPAITRSFDIITDKLRHALIDAERDPSDETTPGLYAVLVQADRADDMVHVAMARHLDAVGKAAEAMKLLDAVVLLSPACRDAWLLKAAVARNLGLVEEAVAAEVEAVACDGEAPLFGIPGKAVA